MREPMSKLDELTRCVVVASLMTGISLCSGLVPLFIKKSRRSGTIFSIFNTLIVGINFGNICYDMIPEMTGDCDVNRTPYLYIGLVVLALIAVESIFVKEHHHEHHHEEVVRGESGSNSTLNSEKGDQPVTFETNVEKTEKIPCTHDSSTEEEDFFGQHHLEFIKTTGNYTSLCIFLFAISLHSFLEGLDTTCATIFSSHIVGLLLHKCAESLSIGMALYSSKLKKSHATLLLCCFVLLTPVAIFVGRVIRNSHKFMALYFKALALGSLMYVVFFEGMGHCMHGRRKWLNIILLTLGYLTTICIVELAHGHGHDHSHGHSH
ncbi:ZIP family transporter [Enterospora canceri]|uniref:ZIP family transporter n=1 Tax=Enterospora canceri TaxID=1081671 RepID=A0A1Y1S951_9MICR|nr:ZIP family transporter [Enterospora canceri]